MAAVINQILWYVTTFMGWILQPIVQWSFSWWYDGTAQTVPTIEEPLLLTSATQLAQKIRKQEVSAVKVMEAFIGRVTEVNPLVNAVVGERYEDALKEAMEVDKKLKANGNLDPALSVENAPFLGVPVSIKEAFAVKGMPNSSGLVSRRAVRAETDAPVVANLRRAGAIPFVVTNTSELCMWLESSNNVYGCSKNPYNTGRIVGGSSGGEGCVISSGGSVFGIGSDIGGSIRMPAFFNGIFGHKPSKGVVKNEGQFPLGHGRQLNLLATGPMCRYAVDLKPMLKVLGGQNTNILKLDQHVDLKSVRMFTMEDDGGCPLVSNVDPELREAQRKVVDHFRNTVQCQVTTVTLSKMKHSLGMWMAKIADPSATKFYELMGGGAGPVNTFWEFFKWSLGQSSHTLPAIGLGMSEKLSFLFDKYNDKLESMLSSFSAEVQELLGEDGVLLYPTHPRIAPHHNQPLLTPMDFSYTAIFNALELPVTQCPLGLSKAGLPLGLQVVTTLNSDRLTLAVAEEIEKAFGGWTPPGK